MFVQWRLILKYLVYSVVCQIPSNVLHVKINCDLNSITSVSCIVVMDNVILILVGRLGEIFSFLETIFYNWNNILILPYSI